LQSEYEACGKDIDAAYQQIVDAAKARRDQLIQMLHKEAVKSRQSAVELSAKMMTVAEENKKALESVKRVLSASSSDFPDLLAAYKKPSHLLMRSLPQIPKLQVKISTDQLLDDIECMGQVQELPSSNDIVNESLFVGGLFECCENLTLSQDMWDGGIVQRFDPHLGLYLIRFTGYDSQWDRWLPATNLRPLGTTFSAKQVENVRNFRRKDD
jgi:hypothetical protein